MKFYNFSLTQLMCVCHNLDMYPAIEIETGDLEIWTSERWAITRGISLTSVFLVEDETAFTYPLQDHIWEGLFELTQLESDFPMPVLTGETGPAYEMGSKLLGEAEGIGAQMELLEFETLIDNVLSDEALILSSVWMVAEELGADAAWIQEHYEILMVKHQDMMDVKEMEFDARRGDRDGDIGCVINPLGQAANMINSAFTN